MKTKLKSTLWITLVASLILYSCECKICSDESDAPVSLVSACNGQEVATADVLIEDLAVEETATELIINVTVKNNGDDDAKDIKLFVLLPIEVNVISFTTSDPDVVARQCRGYVEYSWNSLSTPSGSNSSKSFSIKTSRFEDCDGVREICRGVDLENVSAFVTNTTPDIKKENNYKYWTNDNCKAINPTDGTCRYSFLRACLEPEIGDGIIVIPTCPGRDETCFIPVDVSELCKRVINCPGCDFSSLCIGDMFEFEVPEKLEGTLYAVDPKGNGRIIEKLSSSAGKMILKGTDEIGSLDKEQKLVIVLQHSGGITDSFQVKYKFTSAMK